jgi:uncharacterized repeat protein (TIGR03803 family)
VLYKASGDDIVLDRAGNIYGSIGPGKYGNGAISELLHGSNGWTLKTLYSFCGRPNCPDGEDPLAPLTWDAAGNLYGTTLYGGNGPPKCVGGLGCGVAFQMTPNSDGTWKYHVLHRFAAFATDGQSPDAGVVVDAAGNVYGTTNGGGAHYSGTVFKLTPTSDGHWKETMIHQFLPDCVDGCVPNTTLVFDRAGNLYGTSYGGNLACGGFYCDLIFKLTRQAKGKWKYSVLHKFTGHDGQGSNSLTIDGKGNLFGTTKVGGTYNYGVAFEITP